MTADEIREIDLMRHALGVCEYHGGRWKKPYRNHFVAGSDDVPTWDALVAAGRATRGRASALTGGDPVYYVTDAGRAVALAGFTFKRKWGYR
jgi:hypothetical protein